MMAIQRSAGNERPVLIGRRKARLGPFAIVVLALGFSAAGCTGSGGAPVPLTESPATTPVATPAASAEAVPAPTVTASSAPAPMPTAAPIIAPCDPAHLAARITLWEGAAGHRIAHVELTNAGSSPCLVPATARPQLVDGHGSVLIDGAAPTASEALEVAPGGVLKTLVQDGNYCGPAPVAPVSVAFVLGDGGRIVATPFSPTDDTVPPCLGAPGSAGDIEMQPWAP